MWDRKGEGRVNLMFYVYITKLEPQSTLKTVTQHMDDTNTNH